MICQAFREEIEAVDRRGDSGGAVSDHAHTCAGCAEFRREREALRRLIGGLGRVEAPPDFEYRLRARMRADRNVPRGGLLAGLYPLRIAGAIAACFVLVMTAAVYLRRPSTSAPAQPPPQAARQADESRAVQRASTNPTDSENGAAAGVVATSPDALDEETRTGDQAAATPFDSSRTRGSAGRAGNGSKFVSFPASRGAGGGEVAMVSRPVPVRLPRSDQPLRVVLRDESGAEHIVSMRPVSFGSQELLGNLNYPQRVSEAQKEGVW